jgi:peptidoglycan LD-endopeptidase CwlK
MASRSLDDLSKPVALAAVRFIELAKVRGLDILIYCTLRSDSEQHALFGCGRSLSGVVIDRSKVITNCDAGQSLHNPDKEGKAWAFDAVPLLMGKPQWNDAAAVALMGACGEAVGLEWAGRWNGALRESVHFQIRR